MSFTKTEARARVGKKIRTKVEFPDVQKGTTGEVIEADNMGWGKWAAVVRWDLPERKPPLDGWFTKPDYEKFLEEL